MNREQIKQSIEKFRTIITSGKQSQFSEHMVGNYEYSKQYCRQNYTPTQVVHIETDVIVKAAEACFKLYIDTFQKQNFDSSIYALCCLGASYGTDNYMYENGIMHATSPIKLIQNGNLTDNELGEIKAYENLINKYGVPNDFKN